MCLQLYVLLSGKDVGETVLYFGCRHKAEDFLYQEELEAFEKAGALTQLNVAFSRDQEHKVPLKTRAHTHAYIQAWIQENISAYL